MKAKHDESRMVLGLDLRWRGSLEQAGVLEKAKTKVQLWVTVQSVEKLDAKLPRRRYDFQVTLATRATSGNIKVTAEGVALQKETLEPSSETCCHDTPLRSLAGGKTRRCRLGDSRSSHSLDSRPQRNSILPQSFMPEAD